MLGAGPTIRRISGFARLNCLSRRDSSRGARRIVIAAAVCCQSAANFSSAEAREFRPALIGVGPRSLLTQLSCPRTPAPDATVGVLCQTEIDVKGVAKSATIACYADNNVFLRFAKAGETAMRKARFEPARIDGEPVPVFMSFRLVFTNKLGECQFTAIPNFGNEWQQTGVNYVAPQEIVTKGNWLQRSYSLGRRRLADEFSSECGMEFSVSARVTTDGLPEDVRIDKNFTARDSDLRAATKSLGQSIFIPGFYQGLPTEMRFRDFLHNTCR